MCALQRSPRVLAAVCRHAHKRLAAILRGWTVTMPQTADEVERALACGTFDLIVIGAHFDEWMA
jgi:hypothetical protein